MRSVPTVRPAAPALAVRSRGLLKGFAGREVLRGIDLEVPEESFYVLVGPNGAGKTTLFGVLLGLLRSDGGTAEVLGLDCGRDGPTVRAQVGYVPERHHWAYGWLRVERLLRHHAAFFPTWDPDYAEWLCRAFEVDPSRRVGRLSKGQARRVQLVTALAHRPTLLLLDEPTDGLDPIMRDEMLGLLVDHLAATPTTVLMATHLVHEVERLADHVGVLRGGRLELQAPVDELRAGLRRYRAEVPEGWAGVPTLNGSVVRRQSTPREVQWTVWGAEAEVVGHFVRAGAVVRDVSPLSLEDATLALLSRKD